jgi:galactofuranose transport system substrate-binding protein
MNSRIYIVVFSLVLVLLMVSLFYTMNSLFKRREETEIEFLIGVAQANLSEPWRVVMNEEIQEAIDSYSGVRAVFSNAGDSSSRQEEDIERLIALGIDLLIVSPVESTVMTPVIKDVYERIPVILLDKGVEGYDYTLFIGSDNRLVGKQAARFVKRHLAEGGGRVVEFTGRADSLSVIERKKGFREELADAKNVEIITSYNAEWLRDRAEDITKEHIELISTCDIIFAHNDAMAYGAYKALDEAGIRDKILLGIDGLTGSEGGLALVERGILHATITCPTGGKEAVTRAMDILQQRDGLPKKIFLRSSLITKENLPQLVDSSPVQRKGDSDEPIVLGFAQVGKEGAWREANTKSIKGAAEREGITLLFRDAELDQEKQIAAMRSFIEQEVDVIAFSPIVETGWEEVLREARNAGIPVICSDRTVKVSDETLFTTYLGADFVEEGRRAARWFLEETEDREEVLIVEITGFPGSAPAVDRKKGFHDAVARSNSHRIIDSESGNFIYNKGYSVMNRFLMRHERIDAVYAHNDDMALGAIKAIEEAGLKPGEDILLVSIDGVKAAFEAMKEGKLNCTVECSPLLGPQLMNAVQDYMNGEELPFRINTEEGVFPMETAEQFISSRKY